MLSEGRARRRRARTDRLSCLLIVVVVLLFDVALAYLLAQLWEAL